MAGNDTIDRYPLPYEGELTKLLCISKERFSRLTLAIREFLIKELIPRKAYALVSRKEPLHQTPALPLLSKKETIPSEYMPTPIWHTRESELWQWQRLSEWWREYRPDEILNEKRHILV
jgi:hypothetical protein